MSEPWFWRSGAPAARGVRAALLPAALLYDAGQRLRARLTAPVDPGVPVICVGNASVGGTGKTPFCLLLQRLLAAEGMAAAFLTRGYGGALQGPVRVNAQHTAEDVGDEALLLAAAAPAFVAKDRAAGARAAAAAGADLIIMDDGFQNPAVKKKLSFLLLSGDEDSLAQFPAGPMREPVSRAMARAGAVVFPSLEKGGREPPAASAAGLGRTGGFVSESRGSRGEPSLSRKDDFSTGEVVRESPPFSREGVAAFTVSSTITPSIPPQRVVAFCGVARPERFFDALEAKGFTLADRRAFRDHHPFTAAEITDLRARARKVSAALITTEKDFVRLAPADREGIAVARLALTADDPASLVRFVRERINP